MRILVFSIVAFCFAIANVSEASLFTGSVSYPADINATNQWANSNTRLSWSVFDNANGSWHYRYVWSTSSRNLSHIIFELSDNVTAGDIFNVSVTNGSTTKSVSTFGPGSGNPFIPGSVYGVKFETDSTANTTTIDFDIFRAPTWGDFYAKNGGGTGANAITAWNTGFAGGETAGAGNDPVAPAANGSLNGHILVPDSFTVIPEPTAIVVWSILGLSTVLCARRFHRRP